MPNATAVRRSRRRWVSALVAFFLVTAVVIGVGLWWSGSSRYQVAPAPQVADANPVMSTPTPTPGSPDLSEVKRLAAQSELGTLGAQVTDLGSGQQIFTHEAAAPRIPASSTKLFTAAAAVLQLGLGDRITTQVVETAPGELVIRGAGDVTLSRRPGGGFFTGAASVQELASKIKEKRGAAAPVRRIIVDNSLREGALFHPHWDKTEIAAGNVAPLDAVMLDAGRVDPAENYSPRSNTPGKDVGAALAAELGARRAEIRVSEVPVGQGAPVVGEVHSAPLSTRLRDMMLHSDNLLAESLAREVAQARGLPGTFEGAARATLDVLRENGVETRGAVLEDNSGMSEGNRLSARNLDSVLSHPKLHPLLDTLPVAHGEGTLLRRFGADSGAGDAAGALRAKTGTLDGVSALAGTVTTRSGRVLSFALLSNDSRVDAARAALDRLAAAIYRL